jgi:hypothetical protein
MHSPQTHSTLLGLACATLELPISISSFRELRTFPTPFLPSLGPMARPSRTTRQILLNRYSIIIASQFKLTLQMGEGVGWMGVQADAAGLVFRER